MQITKGIHHITAIASDPAANFDFYSRTLGLRLVKKTVNFDDPDTYHLYYGDELGTPGTIITFFPWNRIPKGRMGTGEATSVSFAIPPGSLSYWIERMKNWNSEPIANCFSDSGLALRDPDGMSVELVESGVPSSSSSKSGVPLEVAITGIFSTALNVQERFPTELLLTEGMGFRFVAEDGLRFRYRSAGGGSFVDLVQSGNSGGGRMGAGSIHHIAFRAENDGEQLAWRQELVERGFAVSPVMDRSYFHSIYFREPGGILFEIATDPPGFAVDEPIEDLGARLMLPDWLEPNRPEIESALPALGGPR
jgi:catechol 2,3-dioxygenase-like lactoylglutathione lyase family enzyme